MQPKTKKTRTMLKIINPTKAMVKHTKILVSSLAFLIPSLLLQYPEMGETINFLIITNNLNQIIYIFIYVNRSTLEQH